MDALNGLSVLRRELSVTTTAAGGDGEAEMAVSMSVAVRGDPLMIVRPGVGGREVGLRIRAVMVWPLLRPSSMTSFPVRPLPPIMRKCIEARCVLDNWVIGVLVVFGCWICEMLASRNVMLLKLQLMDVFVSDDMNILIPLHLGATQAGIYVEVPPSQASPGV